MRILAIDIGTGTQDIVLFDSTGPVENCVKLVLPSPTQIAARRIRRAQDAGRTLLLRGATMGGGPSAWATDDFLRAGGSLYATLEAAQTFDDDPARIAALGITLVSDDEADALARRHDVESVVLRDLDLPTLRSALAAFEVPAHWDGLALGCLDHGAAPPDVSDRLFRFQHLRRVVQARNDLRAFAFRPQDLPPYLTRARALLNAVDEPAPVAFMDTGPAAALGALQDPRVRDAQEQILLNLGNMHALAFHLRGTHVHSLYEHHTGEMSVDQIEDFTRRLPNGRLAHDEVFNSKGHGVFHADPTPPTDPLLAVTGPQRGRLRQSALHPYFATPQGDMMVSGSFGLIQAFGIVYPTHADEIAAALALPHHALYFA